MSHKHQPFESAAAYGVCAVRLSAQISTVALLRLTCLREVRLRLSALSSCSQAEEVDTQLAMLEGIENVENKRRKTTQSKISQFASKS